MIKSIYYIFFCALLTIVFSLPVQADQVLSTIEEAVNQYNKGDFDGAASNLDYAAQLIRQKKSDALKEVFPEPIEGWQAEPATSQATGTAAFGRSISVSRTYQRNSSKVTIDIVSDSPVMQSLLMMLNNPVFAGAGGAELETFNSHKGIIQYNETNKSGDINIVVDDQFMVTVKGQEVGSEDLLAYAKAVKYSYLTKK